MPNDPLIPRFVDPGRQPRSRIRSRGDLPHLYKSGATYFITFRLADAVAPADLRPAAHIPPSDPETIAAGSEPPLTQGSCCLGKPDNASLVRGALLHFHPARYFLRAWCIMPNHVHAVVTVKPPYDPSHILHSWKSFTAKKINALAGTTGIFWERESFDHLCRSPRHVDRFMTYTLNNPVAAGFCSTWEQWPWSGRNV